MTISEDITISHLFAFTFNLELREARQHSIHNVNNLSLDLTC